MKCCKNCNTILYDHEVIDGKCFYCGSDDIVDKKNKINGSKR